MSDSGGELRADPAVLAATCSGLSAAAEHMLGELTALDSSVDTMLARWRGASGSAYRQAWVLWSRGADDVEKGLAVMADLLGRAGEEYDQQDEAGRVQLGNVGG